MVSYRIQHQNLLGFENMDFAVNLVKLTKVAKNRTFGNASNCCSAPLKILKVCSGCGKEVASCDCTSKLFKLGKENIAISAKHLTEIKNQLDSDKITITEFRDLHEVPDQYYTDILLAAKQDKKYKKEYNEYAEILRNTGKTAIGEFILNNRPYPIMLYPYQGHLVIRCLHYFEEVSSMPSVEPVMTNQTKVNLLTETMSYNVAKNPFDIASFINTREEAEQNLIATILRGETLPAVEKTEVKTTEDTDEITRLRALIQKKKEMESAPTV